MRTIKIWKDPYNLGFDTTIPKEITFEKGITILTGCNGLGKSTLLHNIKDELVKEKIPYYLYDNLHDGGTSKVNECMSNDNIKMSATLLSSSEGENIENNLELIAKEIGSFVKNGNKESNGLEKIVFDMLDVKEINNANERWILFDSVDSGYSIDNIIEFKNFLHFILENEKNKDIYIIVTSNSYEMTIDERCLDVDSGKIKTFKTYDSFKKYILKSREIKNKRYE